MGDENFYIGYAIGLIKGLCDFPDEVRCEKATDDRGVLLIVMVNKLDMGKVIGIQGGTIQAVRKLVSAVGAREHARVAIKIDEPGNRS